MTSAAMFQEFQVLLDTLDTQNLPDIPVEQFFIFANIAVDEYMQAARIAFETTRKITEDVSPLVKRGYIIPIIENDRVIFSTSTVSLVYPIPTIPQYTPVYYTMNGVFESRWINGDQEYQGKTQMDVYQQDDITVSDPFTPKYADKVPVVFENKAIIASPPDQLKLDLLVGTFLVKPAIISQTTNCNLAEQIHHTLVKRTVELALEDVESKRVSTFNQ